MPAVIISLMVITVFISIGYLYFDGIYRVLSYVVKGIVIVCTSLMVRYLIYFKICIRHDLATILQIRAYEIQDLLTQSDKAISISIDEKSLWSVIKGDKVARALAAQVALAYRLRTAPYITVDRKRECSR